jgi:hypothetical protein
MALLDTAPDSASVVDGPVHPGSSSAPASRNSSTSKSATGDWPLLLTV